MQIQDYPHPLADEGLLQRPLSPEAQYLLTLVGEAPAGLPWERILRASETGGSLRETYVTCSHAGLLTVVQHIVVLTEAGARRAGMPTYRGNDPSTWPAEQAEKMFLRGYCHALAIALHRLFGHELVMAAKSGLPLHVLVRRDDGVLLDFDGETTIDRIQQDCGLARARLKIIPLADETALQHAVGGRLAALGPEHVAMATRFVLGNPERFARPAPAPM